MIQPKFNYEWTLADAVFTKDRGKVFSCFACGGGSTMGYKLAGFDVIGCNDIDPQMMSLYRANHNPKYSYLESIETFKNKKDLPAELYDLDILDGSPPCSSFSMAGDREKGWGQEKKFREGQAEQVLDNLFFDFIDLAKRLQSKVVVAENVQGLLLGNAMDYVRRIYDEFDKAGYYCQHWLLNAADMGVPQSRPRVFFVCLRKDLAEPFLNPVDLFQSKPTLNLTFGGERIPFGDVRSETGVDKSETERGKLIHKAHPSDKSMNDVNMRVRNKNSGFNALIIHDDVVCPTITSSEMNWRFHDKMACSNYDYTICGSFPLDYDFTASDSKSESFTKYVVGMSVPPLMTANIADQIHEQWLSVLAKPEHVYGPCAKTQVTCTLKLLDGTDVVGGNWCRNPQSVCPREPGEDYTKCKTVCDQMGHAEVVALELAGERDVRGARAEITGHTYACMDCQHALYAAGIDAISVVNDDD